MNFWIIEPSVLEARLVRDDGMRAVEWSGIIPGGWSGVRSAFYDGVNPGILFRLFFKAVASGQPVIAFEDLDARLNDGKGTPAALTGTTSAFVISETTGAGYPPAEYSATSVPEYSTGAGGSLRGILLGAALAFMACLLSAILYAKKRKQS